MIEVLTAPIYMTFVMVYSFFINWAWYDPEVMWAANITKATWFSFLSVFEANAYFESSEVEFLKIFELQFLNCDIIMWKYWLFHFLNWGLPSFDQIDSDLNPSAESELFRNTASL